MKNNNLKHFAALSLIAAISTTYAQAAEYQVTVTNLTYALPLTPILAVTHSRDASLFKMGEAASSGVAAIAQDGDIAPLKAFAEAAPNSVADIYAGNALTMPGKSTTFTIKTKGHKNRLTLLSMLIPTNDAFVGLNAIELSDKWEKSDVHFLPAMDAGAEDNDEKCMYIPGPVCKNPNKASDKPGEGFIHIHRGIHGVGDLSAATYDWRNPTTRVTIVRTK